MAETLKSLFIPLVASVAGFLTLSMLCTDNSVSADTITTGAATSGGDKMNDSLTATSGKQIPKELIATRLRLDNLSSSVASYDGLVGKTLTNTSHSNVGKNARLNTFGVESVTYGDVHKNTGPTGAVLPPIVDPSTQFLQSEMFVSHPYPSFDIRGDPKIDTSSPLEAPMPAQGPWQPQPGTIRQGTSYPLPMKNAASQDFFE